MLDDEASRLYAATLRRPREWLRLQLAALRGSLLCQQLRVHSPRDTGIIERWLVRGAFERVVIAHVVECKRCRLRLDSLPLEWGDDDRWSATRLD